VHLGLRHVRLRISRISDVGHNIKLKIRLRVRQQICSLLLCFSLGLLGLSGCSLPQIKAEDRLFLPLSLEFLGSYRLPKQDFEGTRVGGLSGLTYDRQRNRLYAVSDDRSDFAPARFYTLRLALASENIAKNSASTARDAVSPTHSASPTSALQSGIQSGIQSVEIESVTALRDETGQPYAKGTVDLEGIALSPKQTLYISSEGNAEQGIPPFVDEFGLANGQWQSRLSISERYKPDLNQQTGVQNNQGFESLTLSAISSDPREPFRLFTATENALQQDLPAAPANPTPASPTPANPAATSPALPTSLRFLHYLVGQDQTLLLSEHLYPLDPLPEGAQNLGLTDLLVLDQGGHFLSLERSFGVSGFGIKIFQLATGGATDIAPLPRLSAGVEGIMPIQKRLLLDLSELSIPLDNFEGFTLGPQLPDGSSSLLVVSDDNFNELQVTEFLLFRLKR
jgi:hypothetical protein